MSHWKSQHTRFLIGQVLCNVLLWALYLDPDHVLLLGNWNTERSVRNVPYDPPEDISSIVPPEDISSPVPPEDVSSFVPPEETPLMVVRWEPALSSTDIGEASVVILVTSIVLSLVASIGNHPSPNTLYAMFCAFFSKFFCWWCHKFWIDEDVKSSSEASHDR